MNSHIETGDSPKFSSKSAFLNERLNYHINDFEKKRNNSRRAVCAIKIITIVTGGATTTLLGLKGYAWASQYQDIILSLALIFSAVSTMVVSWESFSDNTWKWVRYRSTLSNLYNIRDDIGFEIAGNAQADPKTAREYFDRLNLALEETNEDWMSKRVKTISGTLTSTENAKRGPLDR